MPGTPEKGCNHNRNNGKGVTIPRIPEKYVTIPIIPEMGITTRSKRYQMGLTIPRKLIKRRNHTWDTEKGA